MSTEQESDVVTFEAGETNIAPLVAADTGDMVATRVLVHVFLAFGAFLAGFLDHVLRCLFFLLTFPIPAVVLFTRLLLVPGDVVMRAMAGLAFPVFALELGTVLGHYLARFTVRCQTPPKARDVLEGCAGGQIVVAGENVIRRIPLDIVVLEQLRALGTL